MRRIRAMDIDFDKIAGVAGLAPYLGARPHSSWATMRSAQLEAEVTALRRWLAELAAMQVLSLR